jgi:hypothetical protein
MGDSRRADWCSKLRAESNYKLRALPALSLSGNFFEIYCKGARQVETVLKFNVNDFTET